MASPQPDRFPLVLRACTVDRVRGEVVWTDGRVERLSPRELELITYVAANADRNVPREELLARVWRFAPSVVTRAIDTTVRRLREKIEVDPKSPDHLITVFGEGYRFVGPGGLQPSGAPEDEPFVGRSEEVRILLGALRCPGASMLLHGPPGAGKTRIANHLLHRLAGELRGGSVMIDLTDARDLPQVTQAAAGCLGIDTPDVGPTALRRAGEALRSRGPCLAVLDNCEGVCGPVGDALESWRRSAPEARFLATSRDRVDGVDDVVQIGPLPLGEAVALFETLARRTHPEFRIDGDARAVVETLVERLERMPLAIALAAERAGALSPKAILQRLDDRFRLLSSRSRDGGERHRTLRAALDSSWELLTEREQAAFLACAAFRGGFDPAAGHRLIGPGAPDLLAVLCSRSLLELRGGRYTGYTFVREYANGRLAEDPDTERAVHRLHAECFADRVREAPAPDTRARLSRDRMNLVVATERAAAAGWADVAGCTALATVDIASREGPLELGVDIARCGLSVAGLPLDQRVNLGLRLGSLEQWSGVGDPGATLDEALRVARSTGDPVLVARALRARAMRARRIGSNSDALADLVEALSFVRTVPPCGDLYSVISDLGVTHWQMGGLPDARACWQEVIGAPSGVVGESQLSNALQRLGQLEAASGSYDEARVLFGAALEKTTRSGDLPGVASARLALGNLEMDLGRWDAAREQFLAGLEVTSAIGRSELDGSLIGNLGACARAAGRFAEARTHLGAAADLFERQGQRRQAARVRANLGQVESAAGNAPLAVQTLRQAVDTLRELGDAAGEAEAATDLAAELLKVGDLAEARRVIDRAERLARELESPLLVARSLARRGLVERAEGKDAGPSLAEAERLAAGADTTSDTWCAIEALRLRPDVAGNAPRRG